MHQQLHHRKAGAGNTYLFNVVVRNQTDGLVIIVGRGLFLGLPPVIIAALFQNVENIPLGNLQLPIGLGGVVVDGLVDAEKPHGSCWSPAGCRVAVLRCRRPHRRSRDVSEVSRGEGAPQSRARAGRGIERRRDWAPAMAVRDGSGDGSVQSPARCMRGFRGNDSDSLGIRIQACRNWSVAWRPRSSTAAEERWRREKTGWCRARLCLEDARRLAPSHTRRARRGGDL